PRVRRWGASQFLSRWQLSRNRFGYSNVAVPLTPALSPRRGRRVARQAGRRSQSAVAAPLPAHSIGRQYQGALRSDRALKEKVAGRCKACDEIRRSYYAEQRRDRWQNHWLGHGTDPERGRQN